MSGQSMVMRWEKLQQRGGNRGPGPRWGHTCNAIKGGKLLYVFGGYGENERRTNQVHIFDTVNQLWYEPFMRGRPPTPRDSHSCTTVGDNLFVFGGSDGTRPLNDLHVLNTSINSWILPTVSGKEPEPREGHSAALIGKRLFIFGGCGKSENCEIYYDDLYMLDTETFVWRRVVPSGSPPSKRESHTCSSWKNKIIVIGGEDLHNSHLSDVHELDADTLVWRKINTTGQRFPPRGGHTTIGFGKNLFVFGGFSNEQNLYDDVYMLDIENTTWTKIVTIGEGPSGRFSVACDSLDPQMSGALVFIGGCNKNLEALDDMYYLHTGLSRETERDERRIEKLSLRKQLKLKCQAQGTLRPTCEKVPYGVQHERDNTIYRAVPIATYIPPGNRTFQANVTERSQSGITIETVIDGKFLRGALISKNPSSISTGADNANRKEMNEHGNPDSGLNSEKSVRDPTSDGIKQADSVREEPKVAEAQVDVPASGTQYAAATQFSMPQEVAGATEPPKSPDVDVVSDATDNPLSTDAEIYKEDAPAIAEDQNTPLS